jgi:hypothetical protein
MNEIKYSTKPIGTMTMQDASDEFGIEQMTLRGRLIKHKVPSVGILETNRNRLFRREDILPFVVSTEAYLDKFPRKRKPRKISQLEEHPFFTSLYLDFIAGRHNAVNI